MDWVGKTATVFVALSVAYILKKRWRSPISDVRGPDDSALIFLGLFTPRHSGMSRTDRIRGVGHLKQIWHSDCNALEDRFLNEYGGIVRYRGTPFFVR
jgi:hypothetical protein